MLFFVGIYMAPTKKEIKMSDRKPSGITVQVLHTTEFANEQARSYKILAKKNNINIEDCDLRLYGTWGFVKTSMGVYVLSRTGLGNSSPISLLPVQGCAEGHLYLYVDGVPQLGPVMSFGWCLEVLKSMEVMESMPLEDFIVSFGPATDDMFEAWAKIIRKSNCSFASLNNTIMDGDFPAPTEDIDEEELDAEEIEEVEAFNFNPQQEVKEVSDATIDTIKLSSKLVYKKEEVLKYGSFIVSSKCKCGKPKALITTKEGICTCGCHKSHTHCSSCGGILE